MRNPIICVNAYLYDIVANEIQKKKLITIYSVNILCLYFFLKMKYETVLASIMLKQHVFYCDSDRFKGR